MMIFTRHVSYWHFSEINCCLIAAFRWTEFVIQGHPRHVIVRGNNREVIFYEDADYLWSSYPRHALGEENELITYYSE